MALNINRRKFLGSAASAAAAFTIVPRHVLGGPGYVPPSEKITLAHVGFGTQAIREVGGLLADPNLQLIAVCDVEKDGVNYLEWGKGQVRNTIRGIIEEPNWREGKDWVPGGRDVGKEVIETYYKKKGQSGTVNTYIDFREMLEKEKDLDAVKCMTPDHMHSIVSMAAMRKGKHIMVHKPLANRINEGRLIIDVARQTGVKSHFLPARESQGVRTVAEWISQDAIGTLREIHNWSSRPVWPQYAKLPTDRPPVPKDFNWDLWLGPVPDRPYHPWYTHTTFRGWFDFGGGALPDMGIYSNFPLFQTFDLDAPYCVETFISSVCEIVDKDVCAKVQNTWSYPFASIARMRFAAKGSRAPLDIFWYDGGIKPATPEEWSSEGKELMTEGMMFVGDKGKIMSGFQTDSPRIIPEAKMTAFRQGRNIAAPAPLNDPMARGMSSMIGNMTRTARPAAAAVPQENPLVTAIKTGKPSFGDFLRCGPITDAFNLVAISYRMGGKRLLWDAKAGKITNIPDSDKFLTREYRKGWEQGPAA